eukprot:CAMPEP_0115486148 /NCGR_PEP_ID=MMETSP0271-20121206/60286_1 /TAXON_ID=71861 /ORGANISM="Scrippsiella trochoidea, Strain CCMP3099" /LENGTH=189 /DNA_ID=CAMNT_0002914149 /DNA_START=495 /DNA_END=1065 /DNA_ORIENTATION=-
MACLLGVVEATGCALAFLQPRLRLEHGDECPNGGEGRASSAANAVPVHDACALHDTHVVSLDSSPGDEETKHWNQQRASDVVHDGHGAADELAACGRARLLAGRFPPLVESALDSKVFHALDDAVDGANGDYDDMGIEKHLGDLRHSLAFHLHAKTFGMAAVAATWVLAKEPDEACFAAAGKGERRAAA